MPEATRYDCVAFAFDQPSTYPLKMSDKVTHSRILIIGKANAGKTSILKKICGETELPIVRDPKGNRVVDLKTLDPTQARGMHDINYEITYPSRPKFVFYDSRGIESGSTEEIDKVAEFITRRSTLPLSERLHATWICLPLDDDRPVGDAEMRMLGLKNPGEVPVVVVFTKYDGLETRVFNQMRQEGRLKREAFRAMAGAAERLFKEHWLNRIYTAEPPKPPFVRLKDLHKPEGNCDALMDCTICVLEDNKEVQKMFVMAQKYSLNARLKTVVPEVVRLLLDTAGCRGYDTADQLVQRVLSWMPHVYKSLDVEMKEADLGVKLTDSPLDHRCTVCEKQEQVVY
ncbi:hypothetical protein FRB95_003004 [Tulasnella sp. JGI-2019a]|nr:hypothetical protein FRB95_003004 [Tulasnella sp. JGI-2019a]